MQLRSILLALALTLAACTPPEVAIHRALEKRDDVKVAALVAKNPALVHHANPANSFRTPLHEARTRKAAEILFNAGAKLDAEDAARRTPIHVALSEELVDFLVEKGVDPNLTIPADSGRNGLHTAESSHACAALVRHGVSIDSRDNDGRTPVHVHAATAGPQHVEVLAWLLDSGADAHALDNKGRTPLHLAIPANVATLAAKGAWLDVQDKLGATALHQAVLDDQLAKVEALLKAGANPNIRLAADAAIITTGTFKNVISEKAAGGYTALKIAHPGPMKDLLKRYGGTE